METTNKMEDPGKRTPEEKPPINSMTHENDSETNKTDGLTPEDDGMISGADGETTKANGMTSENYSETTKADGMTPEDDGMISGADGETTKANGMTPENESKTSAADDETTKVDSKTPETDRKSLKTRKSAKISEPNTSEDKKDEESAESSDFMHTYCCNCVLKCYIFTSQSRLAMLNGIENLFYKLGVFSGSKPYVFIIFGLMLLFLGFGKKYAKVANEEMEWIPKSMEAYLDKSKEISRWQYIQDQVASGFYLTSSKSIIIVDEENLLTRKGLLEMYKVHELLLSLNSSFFFNIRLYCSSVCEFQSLLSVWNYNETVIRNLTKEEILADVNYFDEHNHDLDAILHVSKRDASGLIAEADATKMTWKISRGLTDESWEHNFTDMFFHNNPTIFQELHPMTGLYYGDSAKGVDSDIRFIAIGYNTMIVYIFFTLGKCNRIDHKVGLAFTGLLCVGIGYIVTLGVCGFLGLETSELHRILPLLLLGIGVDDMFVIVGSLDNLTKTEKKLPVKEQIGLTMKHAGISITITTLSDILAFGIGATSAFPGLRSFCIYNCVGIFCIYFLVITLFISCISLDVRRVLDKRDALFCCYKYSNHKPNKFSEIKTMQIIFLTLAKRLLIKRPIKVLVVIITLALCTFCSWNLYQLEVDNSYVRLLYSLDAPYYSYAEADEKYFPSTEVGIFCSDIPYRTQQLHYLNMSHELLDNPKVDIKRSRNWMLAFHQWAQTKNYTIEGIVPPEKFDFLLDMFLKSAEGRLYLYFIEVHIIEQCPMQNLKSDFCFDKICKPISSPIEKIKCGAEMNDPFVSSCSCNVTSMLNCWCQTPNCTDKISMDTSIKFLTRCFPKFGICFESEKPYSQAMKCFNKVITYPMSKILLKIAITGINGEKLNFMNHLEDVSEKYFTNSCIVFAKDYMQWKLNHVLEMEIKRNICLAFLSVFLITVIMIMNLITSLMVAISVIFTLVAICGFINLWGLYLDTTSCVIITIAVGLVVDYSVHVGFTFMTMKGPKNDRMIITLKEMGPPVFHGGFSTMIAVLPLCLGDTYPFRTFFKVLFLVVTFGLFHGLIFLPVILSLYAPPPYPSAKTVDARRLSAISNDLFQIIEHRRRKTFENQANTNQSASTEHHTAKYKTPCNKPDYKLDLIPILKQQLWERLYFISTQLTSNLFHTVFTFAENHTNNLTQEQNKLRQQKINRFFYISHKDLSQKDKIQTNERAQAGS